MYHISMAPVLIKAFRWMGGKQLTHLNFCSWAWQAATPDRMIDNFTTFKWNFIHIEAWCHGIYWYQLQCRDEFLQQAEGRDTHRTNCLPAIVLCQLWENSNLWEAVTSSPGPRAHSEPANLLRPSPDWESLLLLSHLRIYVMLNYALTHSK